MSEGPRILGLTGSIGMGKSTVARMFADAGVPVFDADAAVHRLQGPGGRVVAAIEAAFPGSTGPGGVDRAILGTRVLGDDAAMQRLEGIVHPAVAEERAAFLAMHRDTPLVVFDIPLLFETGGDRRVDGIAVVSAAPEVQRARTLARPGMTPEKFDAIVARQLPDAEKRSRADHVIATDVPLDRTREAVLCVVADMTQADAIVVTGETAGEAGAPAYVEHHLVHRTGWLRAAVLGANDGIISVSSLLVGVASAPSATHAGVLLAGTAALVGGALSMAAGEYVSVSSQSDTERADLARERAELSRAPEQETAELAAIYEGRGVAPALARQVAEQMMAHDALGAHMRDELGLTEDLAARPIHAAGSSALSFVAGAAVPVLIAVLAPRAAVSVAVSLCALVLLAILGAVGARVGGARVGPAMTRVVFWGAIAMGVTGGIGYLLGTAGAG